MVPNWYSQNFHMSPIGTVSAIRGYAIREGVNFDSWWIDPAKPRTTTRRGIEMAAYLLRRLILVIPTLFGIIAINFVIIQFAPGGPVEQMMAELRGKGGLSTRLGSAASDTGSVGAYRGSQGLDPHVIADIKKMFGFDKPPLTRFADMLWGYLRFDFGRSFFRDKSVLGLVLEKLPVSLSLGLWSTFLIYLVSIPLGIRKAVRDGSRFDVRPARRC
jgi:microcin C transport system permease protein